MTVYGQGVRSAAADMFERGLGRDAVACALGIPSCAVRRWHETFRAVGREVLLDMGKASLDLPVLSGHHVAGTGALGAS